MAWLGAFGAVFLVLAILSASAMVWLFRADRDRGARGAGPLAGMVGLAIGAALLGLMGLVFVMTANSDSFGR